MAGIFAILTQKKLGRFDRKKIKKQASKIKHRGLLHTFNFNKFPLDLIFHQKKAFKNNYPLNFSLSEDNNDLIVIDGQIYNLDELNSQYNNSKDNVKSSNLNLECLIEGYREFGPRIFTQTLGSYSGVLYINNELICFKDPIGAKPLYYCENEDYFVVSSELKALTYLNKDIIPIPPGYIISSSGKKRKFFQFPNFVKKYKLSTKLVKKLQSKLNTLIKKAITDNIRNGEEIGLLFRGGIESVIIAYVAKDLAPNLKVYTVGTEDSKDFLFSKKFAKIYYLDHSIVKISFKDILDVLPKVIYALETYDAALIRSAIPMFIISKYIKDNSNIDVLLTGEGGNELFGGYKYFEDLDTPNSFNQELLNLINIEYKTGLQRLDRIPYYFSIETRAPLFDRRLVEFSLSIPPKLKIFKNKYGKANKWILRKAFEEEIPKQFIWRKKQKFSEGVETQYLLHNYIEDTISNEEFEKQKQISSSIKIRSKEELFYWRIFESKFNLTEKTLLQIRVTNNF
ncbi:MAG: asparagine synthase-related protein [Candidatus Thorarchaeota archaeon]